MRASVHHCSVSLLEKKNVCFFTVGRPVDDAKQGNLREREKKDSLGRLIRWKCLKANSAKQFKGDLLINQNSTEDGLGIKDFFFCLKSQGAQNKTKLLPSGLYPCCWVSFLETCICLYMSSIGLCLIHLIIMTDMSDAHDLNNNLGVWTVHRLCFTAELVNLIQTQWMYCWEPQWEKCSVWCHLGERASHVGYKFPSVSSIFSLIKFHFVYTLRQTTTIVISRCYIL